MTYDLYTCELFARDRGLRPQDGRDDAKQAHHSPKVLCHEFRAGEQGLKECADQQQQHAQASILMRSGGSQSENKLENITARVAKGESGVHPQNETPHSPDSPTGSLEDR